MTEQNDLSVGVGEPMMSKILLTGTVAMFLSVSAGQALSQETSQDASPLPILIQEDLYILELGIGVSVEVRCFEASMEQGVPGSRDAEGAGDDSELAEGALSGPCGMIDGQTRVHRLLDELQVTSDLAAEMKVRMEQALRKKIEQRIRDNIAERVRRRVGVPDEDPCAP